MTTIADRAIAIARSMESWTYVLGGYSEGFVDCLGLDLKVLEKLGRTAYPGGNYLISNFPRYVPSMVDHWLGPKSHNVADVEPGDFPVFGDPAATDVHLLYAHTGIASTPGNLVSALNPTLGIRETTYAATGLKFVLVLKTGFAKEQVMIPATERPIATIVVDSNKDDAAFRDDRTFIPGIAGQTFAAYGHLDLTSPIVGSPNSQECYRVSIGGQWAYILARNLASVTMIPAPSFTVIRDGKTIAQF